MVIKPMLEELKEKSGESALNESERENLLKVSFNKIPSNTFTKMFPTKEIPDSFMKTLVEVTEGLNSTDIQNFISSASKIAMNKKLASAHIDYDCFARALWNIKQMKYKKQLSELSEKEKIEQIRILIHLCQKIYNPVTISDFPEKNTELTQYQKVFLSTLRSEDVFKAFEKAYIANL